MDVGGWSAKLGRDGIELVSGLGQLRHGSPQLATVAARALPEIGVGAGLKAADRAKAWGSIRKEDAAKLIADKPPSTRRRHPDCP